MVSEENGHEKIVLNNGEEKEVEKPVPGLFKNSQQDKQEELEWLHQRAWTPPIPDYEKDDTEPHGHEQLMQEQITSSIETESAFETFSSEFKQRIEDKLDELQNKELAYKSGTLTTEEYNKLNSEWEQFKESSVQELLQHSVGVDSARYQDVMHYIQLRNFSSAGISPKDRLNRLWKSRERELSAFVKSTMVDKLKAYEDMLSGLRSLNGLSRDEVNEYKRRGWNLLHPKGSRPGAPDEVVTEPYDIPVLPPGGNRTLDEFESQLDMYDSNVRKLMLPVDDMKRVVDEKEREGVLYDPKNEELIGKFLKGLKQIQDKLFNMDKMVLPKVLSNSLDREELMERMKVLYGRLITKIDKRPDAGTVSSVEDVHNLHRRVKATYASVQHRLEVEQRRHIRSQIARLTALVSHAQVKHAIANATEHAPALAHASLASLPEK